MRKGFTLIELLVVTFLIFLLSAMVFLNYRGIDERFALERSTHKLSQDIRRASELAMSVKELNGTIPNGYGIYLVQGSTFYTLYADTSPDEKYTPGADIVVETIYLEKGIQIYNLSPALVSVNFKPPNPTVKISPASSEATITLSSIKDVSKTKTVKVNTAGLVDIVQGKDLPPVGLGGGRLSLAN